MKKRLSILCLILAAAMLCPLTAYAQAEPRQEDAYAEVYAVVSLPDGGELVVDDTPDASLMEDAESYELYFEQEPILSVERVFPGTLAGVQGTQFYSVDFTLPDTEIEIYLTGLRAENVEEIQQTIVDSFVRGEDFNMTDLGFIDAEKTANSDGDDYLCWAASAADMLVYSGWAAQAGFENEDDVLEAFIRSYENTGGNQFYAMAWFFDGAAMGKNYGVENARITDYPRSGAYLPDYAFEQYTNVGDFYYQDMDEIVSQLRAGYAIGLGVDVMQNNSSTGGHAITLWGYAVDNAMPETDPDRYLCMFVTDSDSDELMNTDRRSSPNVMHVLTLTRRYNYYDFTFPIGPGGRTIFYVSLAPYSEDLEHETDSNATRSKARSGDLVVSRIYLSDAEVQEQKTLLETKQKMYFSFSVDNYADQTYRGSIQMQVKITAADGTVKYDAPLNFGTQTLASTAYFEPEVFLSRPALPAGDYVLSVTVNPDRSASGVAQEAYYYNNTSLLPFKVRGTYLLGDFDNDGEIGIMDAAAIQRRLADYNDTFGEKALIRGDVNRDGLDILDATIIQRYLADYAVSQPMAEKYFYD